MFLLIVFIILPIVYLLLKHNFGYWKRKGVPGTGPVFFLINTGKLLLAKKSLEQIYTDIYEKFQNVPFIGFYRIFSPVIIIRDLELIKNITVKEFSHFTDNIEFVDKKVDPLFGRNPFALRGDEWKIVRNQLTPCYTSGKVKSVFSFLENNCNKLVNFIKDQPGATNSSGIEGKPLCFKFTLSNIVNCSLGVEGHCFEDPNSQFNNLFENFLKPDTWNSLKQLLMLLVPRFAKMLRVKFIPKEFDDTLIDIVFKTLKYREENQTVRNDFLDYLIRLKQTTTSYEFTDIDVAAHVAGFFFDGSETSSIVMSFMLYDIAENPQVQSKLREEINRKSAEYEGALTYECVQEMVYLDAVLSESLRMHPALLAMSKLCTSPYTYTKDGRSVTINAGTSVILPVCGLHHDPKYFTDPETFMPERFLGENKDKIVKYSYIPFGEGPRICLGRQFGIMQVKLGIVHIIKNFQVYPNNKTQKPLKLDPTYLLSSPIGGLWFNFKEISSN